MTADKAPKSHAILTRPGFAAICAEELQDLYQLPVIETGKAVLSVSEASALPSLGDIIFARQTLPHAFQLGNQDVPAVVDFVIKRVEVLTKRANRQTTAWTLHAFAIDDDAALQVAIKIEKALMPRMRACHTAFAKKYVDAEIFLASPRDPGDLVIQFFVSSTDGIWFSVSSVREGASLAIGGMRRMKKLTGAPSRSASKLEEAFVFMGRAPTEGQTAVDLGAAPGGWTFVLAHHGANVKAIDHAKLDIPKAHKLKGAIVHLKENGLKYLPSEPVDWMCCDMVMGGRQTLEVLKRWQDQQKMRAFVVNVKLPAANPWPVAREAAEFLATFKDWQFIKAKHLFHDRAEITLMGSRESLPIS